MGRDGCGGSWAPEDFGDYLYRSCRWQKEVQAVGRDMDYNEIILDGMFWNANLPDAIEAFFGTGKTAKEQHRLYLEEYHLTAHQAHAHRKNQGGCAWNGLMCTPAAHGGTGRGEPPFRLCAFSGSLRL